MTLDPRADTLPKIVLANAARMPDTIAMRRKSLGIWRRVTWADVARQMRRIAAGLIASDLAAEPCTVIIGNNEPELFFAEYAIQAAGRAAVCLYPDLSAAELLTVLRDCNARVVVAEDQEQCDKVIEIADRAGLRAIVVWDDRGMAGYADPRIIRLDDLREQGDEYLARNPDAIDKLVEQRSAGDLAVVIYTSGTTGEAKGVMGSHRYLLDCAQRWHDVLDATPGANYVSYISPAWATEQYLGLALCASLPLIVNFPEEPETVSTDVREIGAEFLFFSPRQWEAIVSSTEARIRDSGWLAQRVYRWGMRALLEGREQGASLGKRLAWWLADIIVGRPMRDRLGFTYLKAAVNSGGALSPEVFDIFHALGVSLRNVYGFTEIGIVAATRGERRFDTVGKLLQSRLGETPLQLRIEKNEIQVRGGVIFDGYFGKSDVTRERHTADGWVRSGDAGYFDEQGYLVYLDRLDDLTRLSSGQTVAPQFIETRVRLSPYIRDVIVIGDVSRDFVGALIDIDSEMVGRWAENRQITFASQADLSQRTEVYRLIESELGRVNAGLPEHCRVVRFANLFKAFDADEGELTRSRKLRRSAVAVKYGGLVNALYGSEAVVACSIEAKFQDGRTRVLTADVRIWPVEGAGLMPKHAGIRNVA
jgi:long-chain acyl-CoA synthetase